MSLNAKTGAVFLRSARTDGRSEDGDGDGIGSGIKSRPGGGPARDAHRRENRHRRVVLQEGMTIRAHNNTKGLLGVRLRSESSSGRSTRFAAGSWNDTWLNDSWKRAGTRACGPDLGREELGLVYLPLKIGPRISTVVIARATICSATAWSASIGRPAVTLPDPSPSHLGLICRQRRFWLTSPSTAAIRPSRADEGSVL